MAPSWPWADDRLARRSRIAHMWRDLAHDLARQLGSEEAAELDEALRAMGQDWILTGVPTDPDALLTVRELAEVADVDPSAVRHWIGRWPLRRYGTNDAGHGLYRWGDVLEHRRIRQQNA
jgi:hypothetical protein